MKSCVIGDSHVAMLVGGRKLLDAQDLELTAFAQPGNGPEDFTLDGSLITGYGGKLKRFLDRMGTPHSLDLASFDSLILVSRTATVFTAFDLLKGHRVSDWDSTRNSGLVKSLNDPETTLDGDRLITEAALEASLVAMIRANLTYQLCAQIRAACDRPIFIVPCPLVAEDTPERRPKFFGLKRALARGDGDALRCSLERAHHTAFSDLDHVEVIAQPPETITEGCLTKRAFGRDSVRLASTQKHDDTDILHAGPQLGILILERIVSLYEGWIAEKAS